MVVLFERRSLLLVGWHIIRLHTSLFSFASYPFFLLILPLGFYLCFPVTDIGGGSRAPNVVIAVIAIQTVSNVGALTGAMRSYIISFNLLYFI